MDEVTIQVINNKGGYKFLVSSEYQIPPKSEQNAALQALDKL